MQRRFLITGASKRIGLAFARRLVTGGYRTIGIAHRWMPISRFPVF